MTVHMDGSRIANAAAGLGVPMARFTTEAGVDLLSFGGTKNGLLGGEAVLFFREELAGPAAFIQKQAAQLPSKMRYIAAQFEALLADDLWLRTAGHANAMAALLAERVERLDGVRLARRPEVNAVFAYLPKEVIAVLQEWSFFWTWDENTDEVRWMCSFDTTEQDVERFAAGVEAALAATRG
jgi:threonine aldolase